MIKRLHNKNIQSHKDVIFDFVPGINLIIGSSRKGKTVIRRALTWLKDNRPIGNAYVSWWDRDNKKNPKTEHSVRIEVDEDKGIERLKSPNFNGYVIFPEVESFDAVGTSVPEEVTNILNLSEVNIQRQWDQPFLLAESPGKIAEFFNKIIRLDIIDNVLSEAESLRKKTEREIKQNKSDQETTIGNINQMSWISEAAQAIKVIEDFSKQLEEKTKRRDNIQDLVNQFHQYEEELDLIPENLNEVLALMDKIETFHKDIERKQERASIIHNLLDQYDECCDELEKIREVDIQKAEQLMNEIEDLDDKITKKEDKLLKAENYVETYKTKISKESELKETRREIEVLMAGLPDVCPTCGQAVNKEDLL
jgi:DNA repair exonuclease SbcCD ATPase subunit